MRILSYVLRYDLGFAPNPFFGYLTLATCKPRVRKHAHVGDLILGTGSKSTVGNDRIIYAARVATVVPLEDYGRLSEYKDKIPRRDGEPYVRYGDNYYYLHSGKWKQRRNFHHGIENMAKDLSGRNALACDLFWYFGRSAVRIPKRFRAIVKKGPGHKIVSDPGIVKDFWMWLNQKKRGLRGMPWLAKDSLLIPSIGTSDNCLHKRKRRC